MQQAALLSTLLYSIWLYTQDAKRRKSVSRAVWLVVIWVTVIGSRPVSTWFNFGSGVGIEANDSGNPFERLIYFVLIGIGLVTLSRRGLRWFEVVRSNRWLAVFFLYWGLSVVWSDAPFVALKRLIKDSGNVVMVLMILTERDPVEACKALFARCAFLLVPFSVLLIKYFGDLGRAYHVWSGEMMYTGVTGHKNTLGVLALACVVFLIWDFLDRWHREAGRRKWIGLVTDATFILMTLWLLYESHSSTALACAGAGLAVYFGLGYRAVRSRAGSFGMYAIIAGSLFWLLDEPIGLTRLVVVDLLGRDLSLTTRTDIWPTLLAHSRGVLSVLLGAGFNSFWTGDRLVFLYEKLGIIQAHNGYLQTYLDGGAVGVMLLLIYLLTSGKATTHQVLENSALSRMSMVFWVIAVVYNFTEAAFNQMGIMWFTLLLVTVQAPHLRTFAAVLQGTEAPDVRFPEDVEDQAPEPVTGSP